MRNDGYINIQGWMINELELSGNELFIYALIYGFSQDGKTKYRGSISYIQNALKISNRSVIDNINKLIEKGLITKELNSTGNLYYVNIKGMQKVHRGYAESSQVSSAKSSHNNNIYNNNNTNKTSEQGSQDIAYLIKEFERIDLKNKKYYGNKTQRQSAKFLIDNYGLDNIIKVINLYLDARDKGVKYLPSISSPHEMVEKWSKLGLMLKREVDNSNNVIW